MSDGAIATLVSGIITITTMVVGFLTMWVKLKYGAAQTEMVAEKTTIVEGKIDANTALTKAGMEAAITSAVNAANAARTAANRAEELSGQLNGALEVKVATIVKNHVDPLVKSFKEHNDQDQRNMDRIEKALQDISKRLPVQS